MIARQPCWWRAVTPPYDSSNARRPFDQCSFAVGEGEAQSLRIAHRSRATLSDDDGILASSLGCEFQSSPKDGGLQAAASIRLERSGSVQADDFVVGDDETGAGGYQFCAVFGKIGFGNESERSGEAEHGGQHLVEARRLAAVGEEAWRTMALNASASSDLPGRMVKPAGPAGKVSAGSSLRTRTLLSSAIP